MLAVADAVIGNAGIALLIGMIAFLYKAVFDLNGTVNRELTHNGGDGLKDNVAALTEKVDALAEQVDALKDSK